MKKLDIYIFRKFMSTFILTIVLISVIIIVFDISEKMDDFISKHAPFKAIVIDYYFNFVPYLVNQYSHLVTFIAVVFFTSRLAARSEIVAMLSSGISFNRLSYPYLAGAMLIAGMSLYLNNVVIPNSNKVRNRFEYRYIKNPYQNNAVNIHKQISPGVIIYVDHYENAVNTGYKFSIDVMKGQNLVYKMMADYIVWDTIKKDWRIYGYFIRKLAPDGTQTMLAGGEKDTTLNLHPSDFTEREEDVEAMNYSELNQYIDEQRMRGSTKIQEYELEKYQRTAFPFATFILTYMGLALSSRKVRGGTGLHLGLGLGIAFSFILFMKVSTTFAQQGGVMSPLVAVWIPNLLYGVLTYFIVRLAPK